MWGVLLMLSVVSVGLAVYFFIQAVRRRGKFIHALWALLAAPVLFIAGLLNFPTSTTSRSEAVVVEQPYSPSPPTASAEPAPPKPEPAPPPVPVAVPEPTKTDVLLGLGVKPASQHIVEQSVEGDRYYYSWDLPDFGEKVGGVWRSNKDWWVKISGRKVSASELADGKLREVANNGVATSYLVTDGKLKDFCLIESSGTLHIHSVNYSMKGCQ